MKKILTLFIGIMLLMPAALAGAPTSEPFVVYISFNGAVEGLAVDFTCNGKTVTQITNNLGGVLVNVGDYGHFKDVGGCSILEVDCGYDSCRETFNVNNLDCPKECTINYELSEAPPEPKPECTVDSDCNIGYECVSENCVLIPEPEPIVEDKVSSNTDGTIASIESNFGDCIDVVITDSKLTKLFDGIIDFDTEDYDTHEEIKLKVCSETSLDNPDYGLVPYVLIEEGELEYRYVFDDILPCDTCDEISEDEELKINFLDEDIEIIYLSSSKIIVRHGELFDYENGCVELEEIDYNGLPVKIITISEDSVYLSYNGESKQIYKDNIEEVGGIQVYVDESIEREDKPNICTVRVAEDIEEAIYDGDEYNDLWDYSIGDGYIGIRNSEEFKYLDEVNKPLSLGDKIVLPNDFAVIKVNEITESETTEIDIRIRDIYLNVQGDREDEQDDSFSFNNQDYEELFVGDEGILDKDKILISNKLRIGESNVYLEAGSIRIGDLVIELGFMDIFYKGVSFENKEDDYLTYEGIIFKNPEGSVQNEETLQIIVPDEIPKIILTIGAESETVGIEPELSVCPEPTEEECKEVVCEICTVTTCPPEKTCPESDCPEVPEGTNPLLWILSLLGVGGIGTYIGTKITSDRISKVKGVTYRIAVERDGDIREEHRHAGLRNYHSINTSHREANEKHPKGEKFPLYEKDETGTYNYIEG